MKSRTSIRSVQEPRWNPSQPGSRSRALWSVVGTVLVDICAPLSGRYFDTKSQATRRPGPLVPSGTSRASHSTTERHEGVPGDVRGAQAEGVDELLPGRVVQE